MPSWVLYNNKFYVSGESVFPSDNRGYRYGDGFFETIKCLRGKIVLQDLHAERFFKTMDLLQFDRPPHLNSSSLFEQVKKLIQKNKHFDLCRIRLSVSRGRGGLYDPENHDPNILIESYNLSPEKIAYNSNGLVAGIYNEAIKTSDQFSHLKTNNYLCYVMAALHAKKNRWNEAFLCNASGMLADATIANIFILKNGTVQTPSLNDGCIDGVMRKYLLRFLQKQNIPVQEGNISKDDLMQATEVFVTNAISGVRWVQQIENNRFINKFSAWLYDQAVRPLHDSPLV